MISVIVPVYNTEIYLQKCIESIINQTYKDLEIILVNDGSTDSSLSICEEYQKQDGRIKVISQVNQGQANARNTGLNAASGDYIAFVDSDDFLDICMYEELYTMIVESNADISVCGVRMLNPDHEILTKENENTEIKIFNMNEALNALCNGTLRFEVWNKLFKKDCIGEIRFIPKQIYEEIHFDRNVFQKAAKVIYTNQKMHNYLINRKGSTNTYFNSAKLGVFEEFELFIKDLRQRELIDASLHLEANALAFSMSLYLSAFYNNGSKNDQDFLLKKFKELKKKNKKNQYVSKKGVFLFSISPRLYNLKNKILKK